VASIWEEMKLEAWNRLWEDLHIGYLDEDILDLLIEFFLRPRSFTKSSCSGRITVIDSRFPWAKDNSMTVFKKHGPVSMEDIEAVLSRPYARRLWLSVQGPIYHVYVADMEEALEVLRAAREAGFKHSGIMVAGEPMLLELRTGIRGDILLAERGTGPLLSGKGLEAAVKVANEVLAAAKERNRRLLEALRRRRPRELWKPAAEKAKELGLL